MPPRLVNNKIHGFLIDPFPIVLKAWMHAINWLLLEEIVPTRMATVVQELHALNQSIPKICANKET